MLNHLNQRIHQRPILLGYGFAVGAAFTLGTATFVARKIVTEFTPPLVTASFALLFGTVFLLLINYRNIPRIRRRTTSRRAVVFVMLSGLFSSGSIVLLYSALSMVPVTVASPIVSIQPLVALALSHLFLQRLERITLRIVLGALLVVAGVILIGVSNA